MDSMRDIGATDASRAPARGVARVIAGAAGLLAMLAAVPGVGPMAIALLALVPQAAVGKMHVWTLLTAPLVEPFPPNALITVPAFFAIARWVEPVWGSRELARFVLFVTLSSGLATLVLVMIAFYASRAQTLFFTPIGGLTAIVFGLLVVVRQLIPEHGIGPSAFNVRAKFVPLLALTVAVTGAFVRVTHVGTLLYALCGFQLGWVYLRYFQRRENGNGDRSDAFSYDAFFPEPIARPVRVVAAVAFVIFRPLLPSVQSVGLEDKAMSGLASAIDSVDAERHRQRALKALDERLNTANTAKSGAEDPPV